MKNFSLGFYRASDSVTVRTFPSEGTTPAALTLEGLEDTDLQILFYPKILEDELITNFAKEEESFLPVVHADKFSLTEESFNSLSDEQALVLFEKIHPAWIFSHNLNTLRNIIPTVNKLSNLWKKAPEVFFPELWCLLRSNLSIKGTDGLRIIFNDIELHAQTPNNDGEEDQEQEHKHTKKNRLIHSYASGNRYPRLTRGGSPETGLMQTYTKNFTSPLNIVTFSQERGELVATSMVDGGPILILAKLYGFDKVQENLLYAIFSGI